MPILAFFVSVKVLYGRYRCCWHSPRVFTGLI